jgi:hypothetical protein
MVNITPLFNLHYLLINPWKKFKIQGIKKTHFDAFIQYWFLVLQIHPNKCKNKNTMDVDTFYLFSFYVVFLWYFYGFYGFFNGCH